MYKKNGWRTAGAAVIGRGHISQDIPCQDKYSIKQHDVGYSLSLCDGAGSAKHSDIGAQKIANMITQYTINNFTTLYNKNNYVHLTKKIEDKLDELSATHNVEIKDLSSTLLFVVIEHDHFIAGHIGDGIIGCIRDEKIEVLSHPENGEYSNMTFFTTSTDYKHRLRITKGKTDKISGFILMSDGTGESLYDHKNEKLVDQCKGIIEWLDEDTPAKISKDLEDSLKNVITKRTTDDCSIGIMRKLKK